MDADGRGHRRSSRGSRPSRGAAWSGEPVGPRHQPLRRGNACRPRPHRREWLCRRRQPALGRLRGPRAGSRPDRGRRALPDLRWKGPLLALIGTDHAVTAAQLEAVASLRREATDTAGIIALLAKSGAAFVTTALPAGTPAPGRPRHHRRALRQPGRRRAAAGHAPRQRRRNPARAAAGAGRHRPRCARRTAAGIALSRLTEGRWRGTHVISKSGAFGEPGLFADLATAPHPLRHPPERPRHDTHLAITMGDPAGIGPEIIVRAVQRLAPVSPPANSNFSSPATFRPCARRRRCSAPQRSPRPPRARPAGGGHPPGRRSRRAHRHRRGRRPRRSDGLSRHREGVSLAMAGRIQGLVTAPLNKEALNLAGYHYAGHTELLAELTGRARLSHDARPWHHECEPRHDTCGA